MTSSNENDSNVVLKFPTFMEMWENYKETEEQKKDKEIINGIINKLNAQLQLDDPELYAKNYRYYYNYDWKQRVYPPISPIAQLTGSYLPFWWAYDPNFIIKWFYVHDRSPLEDIDQLSKSLKQSIARGSLASAQQNFQFWP